MTTTFALFVFMQAGPITGFEQRALETIIGVLFAGFGIVAWYTIRQLFQRLDRIERGQTSIVLALARHDIEVKPYDIE